MPLRPLTPQAIRAAVGSAAYARGEAYHRQGRVVELRVDASGSVVHGTVAGGAPTPYTVTATVTGGTVNGRCSCPVGGQCKHVGAVLLAACALEHGAAGGTAPVPAWERVVTAVVTDGAADEGRGSPLGLQFDLVRTQPGRGTPTHRVRLRPVVPGRSSEWVRSGITWRDLQYDHGRRRHDPAQREALGELYLAYQAAGRGYWSGSGDAVHLDDFGPSLWPLLERAVATGVALVPARAAMGPVVLASRPAVLRVDVRRSGSAGDAVVEPAVTLEAGTVAVGAAQLVGDPPHGLFLDLSADLPGGGKRGRPGLLLAPLAERVPAKLTPLLRRDGGLRVPAVDLPRFVGEFYPALRQLVPVVSSDGSVELPEVVPPVLALTVTHRPDGVMALDWAFEYPGTGGSAPRRAGLDGPPPAGVARDPGAERRLLGAIGLPDTALPQLRGPAPERRPVPHVELRGMDAVVFAEQGLPSLLAADGIVVRVVGTVPDYRPADSAPVISISATDSASADWFDLGVTVTVDGEEVPFVELFVALARGEQHLVLTSGRWFAIDRPEFAQLRTLIEEAQELAEPGDDGRLRIGRWQVGLWEELAELGVVEQQSRRWAELVGGLLDATEIPAIPAPAGLDAQLRPYQLDGFRWLAFLWEHGLGGILADDMGLGKTLQTLALLCRAAERGELTAPVLVVTPTSVVSNWLAEAARFAPDLRAVAITGTERRRAGALADVVAGAHLVVTSYSLFRLDEAAYRSLPWRGLVLDEAQFVKNHQAKSYQCARRLEAPFKLAITGTPLENSLMDLWSLLSIVAPGLFPSPQRFTEQWRRPIERGSDPALLPALRRRVRPLMLRRTKELVAVELPPKQEQVVTVTLNPRHRKLYQTQLQRERRKVLGLVDDLAGNRFAILRSLTLLRQLALDPALVDPEHASVSSSKADVFIDQVREVVGEGHRALVFSQFTSFLRRIGERLDAEGLPYAYLDGSTRDRAGAIAEFVDGGAPVFLISLKAGGFGLNLTGADYCFVLDPWWNPAAEAQAVDRAHRIGQDKTVMVYRLVAEDTIEEKVMALQARKRDLFTRVVDDDGLMAAPLTAADIAALLAP
jgi:superfamily II DNA or RNA helicase